MLNTSTIIAKKSIGTNLAASVFIKNGVIKGETRVEHGRDRDGQRNISLAR